MKLYADQPGLRRRQVLADVLVVGWVVVWVRIGQAVHEAVGRLAAPGRTLESAGSSLTGGLTSVGDALSGVPLVGGDLREPFDAAGGAAGQITEAGISLQDGVATAALVLAVSLVAGPILLVVAWWAWRRIRFARRAGTASALLASGAGLDLFALRALARQPVATLRRIGDDPAGDWRRGDERTIRALARLELDALGVAVPG